MDYFDWNVTQNIQEDKMATLQQVLDSKLTEEEKTNALETYQKFTKNLKIFFWCWIVIFILLIIPSVVLLLQGKDIGISLTVNVTVGGIIILIAYPLTRRKKKKYANWFEASHKVDVKFDGLDQMTLQYLKPHKTEQLLIKKYKKKFYRSFLNYIPIIVLDYLIISNLNIEKFATIFAIVNIILILFCSITSDDCRREIHRLSIGYYKRDFEHICPACNNPVRIMFQDMENYEDLPRDENNYRLMTCENCGNRVPLSNFERNRDDYKKYLEELQKIGY